MPDGISTPARSTTMMGRESNNVSFTQSRQRGVGFARQTGPQTKKRLLKKEVATSTRPAKTETIGKKKKKGKCC